MTERKFEKYGFAKRFSTMLSVDTHRLLTMPLLYITLGACLIMPILILVMTTMMDGSVTVDPQTGKETVIEGFDNVWQIIGSVSSSSSAEGGMSMGLTAMCNINMLYFLIAVPVCIFVSEDFRSGYSKNLFTVRADRGDYVFSKTVVGFAVGAMMILLFFLGSMLGGAVSGLPFTMEGFDLPGLVMCLLSKVAVVSVFVPIFLTMSVIAKQRLWMSLLLSFAVGMLLFMMIPMLTPLNATVLNPLLCLLGGAALSFGLGMISKRLLAGAVV